MYVPVMILLNFFPESKPDCGDEDGVLPVLCDRADIGGVPDREEWIRTGGGHPNIRRDKERVR